MKLLKEWKLIFNCFVRVCNSLVDNLIEGQSGKFIYDKQTLLILCCFSTEGKGKKIFY